MRRPRWKAGRAGVATLLLPLIFLAGCEAEKESPGPAAEQAPPIILISIDTLRSDRLPAYGYGAIETPAIDRLRQDGVLFRHAYSQAPTTLPAHSTIFTGLLPPRHGVRNNLGYRLEPSVRTLAGELSRGGYATGAAVSAYVLRTETGIASGFESYFEVGVRPGTQAASDLMRPARETNRFAYDWIAQRGEQPFFFFLHYFEPHFPYENGGYDGEIEAVDAALAEFFEFLRARDLYDRSLIILLSDHGEGLGDHGELYHGIFVYRESIQVPLIVKLPGNARAGEEVGEDRALADVMPTILDLAGIETELELDGGDLFRQGQSAIYSETLLPRIHFGWSALRSVISDGTHVIDGPDPELYLIRQDPAELVNRIEDRRRDYAAARQFLDEIGAGRESVAAADQEQRQRLAALGYIGSGASQPDSAMDPRDHIEDLNRLLRGSQLQAEGRCEEAVRLFAQILDENRSFTDAWARSAECLQQMGDEAGAVQAYRNAIEASPSLAETYALALATLLWQQGRPAEAFEHAEIALPADPGGAALLMGKIALSRNDLDEAERAASILSAEPALADASLVLRARIAAMRGDLPGALQMLKRSGLIEGDRPVAGLHLTHGDILARMNRFEEAESAFEREIELHPENLEAYTSFAIMEAVRGRSDRAVALLERMVKTNPGQRSYMLRDQTLRMLREGG